MDVIQKKLRVTLFYLATIGILILATSFFVYAQIQNHIGHGKSATMELLRFIPFAPKQERIAGIHAAILRSELTADHFARQARTPEEARKMRENYFELAEFWKRQFSNRRMQVEIITEEQLETELYRFSLLVMPVVQCMTTAQMNAVKDFLESNKGIILTGVTGNRDEEGNERPWSLTSDITGGRPQFDLRLAEGEKTFTLHCVGNTPLTANTEPGGPIQVSGFDQPIRLSVREQRTQSAAVWLPTDDLRTGLLRDDAAIVYGNYLGGRFVWFGFTAQGIPSVDDFWERFDTIIGNSINWTSRRSIADRLPWPNADHAVTFALRSGRDLNRSIALARHFIQRDIKPALMLDKNTLPVNELALRDIRDSVEFIPSMSVDTEVVKEGLDSTFDQRLNRARNNFRDALNYNVRGFNLPIEPKRTGENSSFDRFHRMGYDYIWIGNNGRYSPDLPIIAHQPIFRRLVSPVFIYQNSFLVDGWDRWNEDPTNNSTDNYRRLSNDWIRQYEFARSLRGLSAMMLPADIMNVDLHHPAVLELLDHISKNNPWAESPHEISRRWRHYENTHTRLLETPNMITLHVSNEGRDEVPAMTIRVHPARMPQSISIRSERIYSVAPEYTINRQGNFIDLHFKNLGRRENRTHYIDLNFTR